MATTETFVTPTQRNFTFDEAIEYMKLRDRYATTAPPIKWRCTKTGRPVTIGYSDYKR